MQEVRIPLSVDPVKSAAKRLTYEGVVPSVNLPRLNELLLTAAADPRVKLWFGTDEQGVHYIRGEADVTVQVACQRCSEPMAQQLQASFQYAPLTRRQSAEQLPHYYDAVAINEFGEVQLHPLVEDELMLAMPLVARHAVADCAVDPDTMSWGELASDAEEKNPFAVLEKLKKK